MPRCDFAPTLKIVLQQSEIIVKHNPLLQWTTRLYMGSPFKWTSKWCCEGGWVRFTKWAVVRIEQILCGITLGLFYQTHFNHNQFKPCVYYTTSMEEDEDNMCNAHTYRYRHMHQYISIAIHLPEVWAWYLCCNKKFIFWLTEWKPNE